MLETASVAGGAVAAMLLVFVVGFFVYLKKHSKNCEIEVESQKQSFEKFWKVKKYSEISSNFGIRTWKYLKFNFTTFRLSLVKHLEKIKIIVKSFKSGLELRDYLNKKTLVNRKNLLIKCD